MFSFIKSLLNCKRFRNYYNEDYNNYGGLLDLSQHNYPEPNMDTLYTFDLDLEVESRHRVIEVDMFIPESLF